MATCAYYKCGRNRRNTKNAHFFRFPTRHKERLSKWLTNCGNPTLAKLTEDILNTRTICEYHFQENSFVNSTHHRLIHTAVPRHYLGHNETSSKEEFVDEDLNISLPTDRCITGIFVDVTLKHEQEQKTEKTDGLSDPLDDMPLKEDSHYRTYSKSSHSTNNRCDANEIVVYSLKETNDNKHSRSNDEVSVFGQFVVQKLRNIKDKKSRAVLQQKICSLIFECELKNYFQENSASGDS